jgi:DNA-directed RNA polymerase specialized sigma24 family protein
MTDKEVITGIDNGDMRAFKVLIANYSADLITLARYLLKDNQKASDLVESLLHLIHERKIQLVEPIHPFLAQIIRAACGYE